MAERFSSLAGRVFHVVEYEDGLRHCGRPGGTAAQRGQDLPGLDGGDGAFAAAADPCEGLVHGPGAGATALVGSSRRETPDEATKTGAQPFSGGAAPSHGADHGDGSHRQRHSEQADARFQAVGTGRGRAQVVAQGAGEPSWPGPSRTRSGIGS